METEKYLKNYWNKNFLLVGILFILIACNHVNKKHDMQVPEISNLSPFIVINVQYQDKNYHVVVKDKYVDLLEKYKDDFLHVIKSSEALSVDSTTFALLNGDIATPQSRIDSVYKGKISTLLSSFFNDNGILKVPLSYDEEKYLIDILYRNNISINIDCETGTLLIEE